MARKTNTKINGSEYYRVTAVVGRDGNGKVIRKQFYGKTKKEAEDKKDEYLNGIKNGLAVNFQDVGFGNLMHLWLFEVMKDQLKPSTFERYEGIYRNYIKNNNIYGVKICNLQSIQLQRYYNKLYKSGKSSNVIKNLNKLLREFLNYAVDEGYIAKNPCYRLSIPGKKDVQKREIQVFTDDEIIKFKDSLNNNRLKALFLLDLGTGLRQGELLALKWYNIDMDKMELHVKTSLKKVSMIESDNVRTYKTIEQTPKSQSSIRTVPIPSKLIPALKRHKIQQKEEKLLAGDSYIDNNYVFATSTGGTIDSRNLIRAYSRALKKANIPYRNFHCLRHTYATKLFERNNRLETVQRLLGHSRSSITADIYTHVMPKQKMDTVETLNDLFV
ncbi:tyrosine-type recombinase/integrase [Clostridium kluyveri]|uniref:Recombinase XerC n=1 Tax=Clostridium kluyveri TaxID=1534 RepID=A0A1L5F2Y8_CLOKL|nr:site-specific integrase [Clostridium kluyveri]APM37312.1 recombinase XerC [Clostridium kluyveri]